MIPRIDSNLGIAGEPDEWVHSACLLCSNDCGLDIAVKDRRIVGVRGQPDHPVNFGHLGPKGEHAWVANNSKRRGKTPMIRRKRGAPLQPASWAEAMDFFVERFRDAWSRGHQNIACYNSGQVTIEELYTLSKFWRGGLQSANIDGNTRLCTATSYADIDRAKLLCLYGHNVAEVQTMLWERMLAAKQTNDGRIIVADPRRTPTVQQGADLHLQLAPGTNVALMNGIIHLLIRDGWVDRDFVSPHTVGFAEMEATVSEYPPERAAMWGEKTGCVTNADRSVNLLLKAVDPPGEAHSDFDIVVEAATRLGFKDRDGAPLIPFTDPKEAFAEWGKVSKGRPCDYSGMSYELILEMGAVRWPRNEQHPRGCERLYEDLNFGTGIDYCETYGHDFLSCAARTRADYEHIDPKGKAFLRPAQWRRQPNPVSEAFPFTLITARVVYHFHTQTKTARSDVLNRRAPHPYVEVHPQDAARLGIGLGDMVEITSPHGRWEGVAMVVNTVRPGEVFVPFHYGRGGQSANQHTCMRAIR